MDAINQMASTVRLRLSNSGESLNSIPYQINDLRNSQRFDQLSEPIQNRLREIDNGFKQLRLQYEQSPLRPTPAEAQRYNDPTWLAEMRQRYEFVSELEAEMIPLQEEFDNIMQSIGLVNNHKPSLLYPAEFMTIISTKSCYLTKTYEQCSRNAYSHSFADRLGGAPNHQYCSEVPEVCSQREGQWHQLD